MAQDLRRLPQCWRCALWFFVLATYQRAAGSSVFRFTADSAALVQRSLQPHRRRRNFTRQEIWDSMKHNYYLNGPAIVLPSNQTPIVKRVNLTDDMYETRFLSAASFAQFMCSLHFLSGHSVSVAENVYLPGLLAEKDYATAMELLSLIPKVVDEEAKTTQYIIEDWQSPTFKYVNSRYGCVKVAGSGKRLSSFPDKDLKREEDNQALPNITPPVTMAQPDVKAAALPADSASSPPKRARRSEGVLAGEAEKSGEEKSGEGEVQKSGEEEGQAGVHPGVRKFVERCRKNPNTLATLVSYNGQLVEHYNTDLGSTKDVYFHGFSMSKSVGALVFAIREDEKLLNMMSLTHGPSPTFGTVMHRNETLFNLLNMITAQPTDEGDARQYLRVADDSAEFMSTWPVRTPVDSGHFCYSTGNFPILSRELRYSFGSTIEGEAKYATYPWDMLFSKIEADFACERDPAGTFIFGSNCYATARDWLKLALLMMKQGKNQHGEQVIPQAFIDELYSADRFYVNGWYRLDILYPWAPCLVLGAIGIGGQRLFIVPKHNLVIAHFGWQISSPEDNLANDEWCGHGFFSELMANLEGVEFEPCG